MNVRTGRSQTARIAAIRVVALLVVALVFCQRSQAAEREATLQDVINTRTEVTVLAQEVAALDAEILVPMRKVVAKGEAQLMAAGILLSKDKYAEAVKAYGEAAALYRQAIEGRKLLERLADARAKAERARLLAETSAPPEKMEAVKRFEINADGYVEAADFEQALADGAKALAKEDLDKAKQSFAQAAEQFATAQNEAQAANLLAKAQGEWAAALAAVNESLATRRAAASSEAAKKLAAAAEAKTAAGDTTAATSGYRSATVALRGAAAEALTAENAAKAVPVVQRLEAALSSGDKFAAEDVLAELEKLIPSDPRMAALRQKVAAVPGPSKTLSLDLGGGVKLDLVLIRPGSFMMGSEKVSDAKPVHQVTITKPFYLGEFEVTQQQWEAVMGSNPSDFKAPTNPVENVSWNDCQEFLKRLSAKVAAAEFRLPTEAEWEYACRAGSTTEFSYGDDEAGLAEYAWYSANSDHKTHPVGGKKPNPWVLYDMHGNVWEWCQDWQHNDYNGAPTDGSAWETPVAAARVLRGGAWLYGAWGARSAYRCWNVPSGRDGDCGLRVRCSAARP